MLSLRQVGKSFAGVSVLRDINLELARGRITGLVGANGAGKSTLIKVLTGYYSAYEGQVLLDGRELHLTNPRRAQALGIHVVHQEVDTGIVPALSVAENLLFDDIAAGRHGSVLPSGRLAELGQAAMARVGLNADPRRPASELSLHERQLLLIARAVKQNAAYLILDEPTASLGPTEVERLFAVLEKLRADGTGIIYVSHKLPEIARLCDDAVALRDGRLAGSFTRPFESGALVTAMLGSALGAEFPPVEASQPGPVRLELRDLRRTASSLPLSLQARAGEVLAITGLVGAGKTELLRAIYGAERPFAGSVLIDGQAVRLRSPQAAVRAGVFLVPEERRSQGLFLDYSGHWNLSFPSLDRLARGGVLRAREEAKLTTSMAQRLCVRGRLEDPVVQLSGGNQQKVVLGKWLAGKPKVVLLDEPTQGVDIGARREIYGIIRDLARDSAVVVATSDVDEALGLADRVIVMYSNRVTGSFARGDADRAKLMRLAVGEA